MDRLVKTRYLYGLAVCALPLSYGVKHLLGFAEITWVDPALVIGLTLFVLWGYKALNGWTGLIVAYGFTAAFVGSWYLPPAFDRPKAAEYVIYTEPVRLALSLAWFSVCLQYRRMDRKDALRWLSISAILQFAIATYLYLGMLELAPLPEAARLYLEVYKSRQLVWFGNVPVYRMAGTFFESPPFGLFMLCCFVVLALELIAFRDPKEWRLQRWIKVGAVVSLIGTIASLSDQVLFALGVFCIALLLRRMGNSGRVEIGVWVVLGFAVVIYTGAQLTTKWEIANTAGQDVYGQSLGERLYHVGYSFRILAEEPASIITGIGPGRYGDYVARTGIFESTVNPGVTVIQWMVEFGLAGLILLTGWFWRISSKASLRFGSVGTAGIVTLLIANMFQMGWQWESWFLALAYLCASAQDRVPAVELDPTLAVA